MASAPMSIRALAPWFGGKRTLAPTIVEELGSHVAYWEPFCGSMAVLFAKPRSHMETVNDLHGDLINLAHVLASDWHRELHERLNRTLMADALFVESKERLAASWIPAASLEGIEAAHCERAYWYMVNSWMGRNGTSGTTHTNITIATRYTSNGGSGGFRWRSAVDSVPAWHERLQNVHIKCVDGVELVDRIEDSVDSAIYVDPPYLEKGTKYLHDFEAADHRKLAEALRSKRETRIVVSYYDHPELENLYPGWTKRPVAFAKSLINSGRRGERGKVSKVVAPEVLLINGPSFALERSLFEQGELK